VRDENVKENERVKGWVFRDFSTFKFDCSLKIFCFQKINTEK
jgi:hypothetical protein